MGSNLRSVPARVISLFPSNTSYKSDTPFGDDAARRWIERSSFLTWKIEVGKQQWRKKVTSDKD